MQSTRRVAREKSRDRRGALLRADSRRMSKTVRNEMDDGYLVLHDELSVSNVHHGGKHTR